MALNFDLSEEIDIWLRECGTETLSKMDALYYRIDYKRGNRVRAFITLLEKLKEMGADKPYFKMGSNRNLIIKKCLAPKHSMNRQKYAKATVCVAIDLDSAILTVFGSESDYYKNNGKNRKIIKTEKSKVEKFAEEQMEKMVEPISKELAPLPDIDGVPQNPTAPKRMWADVRKQLIAEGKLADNPDNGEIDPEVDAILGFEK